MEKYKIALICESYAVGWSIQQIAKMNKVTEVTAMKILMKYYLPIEPSGKTKTITLQSKLNEDGKTK